MWVVQVLASSHLPDHWMSLRAQGHPWPSKGKGLAVWQHCVRKRCWYIAVIWKRKAERYPSPDLPHTGQALLLLCQPHQLLSLLAAELHPKGPSARGSVRPCMASLVHGLPLFEGTFGPLNRITTASPKERKNAAIQRYKPKVLSKKKCHRYFSWSWVW